MRLSLLTALVFTLGSMAWQCPECGTENNGSYCLNCHLPETPAGMVYVPGSAVEVNGEVVDVPGFFIDAEPVTYRDLVQWLNSSGFSVQQLGIVITGGTGDNMEFLAFTPFIGDPDGGIAVPSQCLEDPAASITWSGAQSYLSDRGKRLPTLAEMYAAESAGLLDTWDAYEAMLNFSSQLLSSMGEMLGSLGTQAMFSGYSTERERVMWELTSTVFGHDPNEVTPPSDARYVTIFKAVEQPVITSISRDNGYFNVIFRGAAGVPRPE